MTAASTTQAEKARRFQALHARPGVFVIPNPWDPGSTRLLEALGYEALATTSAGYGFSLGRLDGDVSADEMIEHCRALCASTGLPISADLENGYSEDPKKAAQTLVRGAEAGLVGGSIEDYSVQTGLYPFDVALERVKAAVEAVRKLPFHFVLTARAENLIRGVNDLDDTIRRLQAFEAAGADVLYAPGLKSLEEVRRVCSSVGKPVNINMTGLHQTTVKQLGEAGAKRISTGGALARAAIAALVKAGREMQDKGTFTWADAATSGADIKKLLG